MCVSLYPYQLHEAVAEAEEQRRQVQVAKKKAQRLTTETQDTKLHLEEQMTRNNELERKQRRFVRGKYVFMGGRLPACRPI